MMLMLMVIPVTRFHSKLLADLLNLSRNSKAVFVFVQLTIQHQFIYLKPLRRNQKLWLCHVT